MVNFKAFGVGAFEDDDVNIYTNYDFSQYDFSIGGGAESSTAPSSSNASRSCLLAILFYRRRII